MKARPKIIIYQRYHDRPNTADSLLQGVFGAAQHPRSQGLQLYTVYPVESLTHHVYVMTVDVRVVQDGVTGNTAV